MARTSYEVILQADGNHKVTARTDDPAELMEAIDCIKNVYGWMEHFIQKGELHKIKDVVPAKSEQTAQVKEAPICAIHEKPMKWIDKNGGFWSCHQKNNDGAWCNYRPGKAVA